MTTQGMMERFDLPEELVVRLPILASLLNGRDQVLAEGFSYERMLLEMSRAIASSRVGSLPSRAEYSGQCWIHPEAIINEEVTIEGPCIVCRGAEVGPQAFLGAGTLVGPFAKLGYGVVVKATIIGARSKIKYRTSIANSIIGESADISETVAVATPPNRRSPVRSWTNSGQPLETNLAELGSQIGTQAEITEGSLILPGSVICDEVKVRNSTINGYVNSLDTAAKTGPAGEDPEEAHWPPSFFPTEHRKGPAVTSNKVLLTAVVILALLMAGLLGLAFFSMTQVDSLPKSGPSEQGQPDPVASQPIDTAPAEGTPRPLAAGQQPRTATPPTAPRRIESREPPRTERPPDTRPPERPAPSAAEDLPLATTPALTPLGPPGFTLQVGSFKTRARAEVLERQLQAAGFSPYVVEAEIPGTGRYYRVRVGRFPDAEEARNLVNKLRASLGTRLGADPWVVPYGPTEER